MRWFTADTHFSHPNVLEFCNRPFESVEQMNETMVAKWNNRVSKGDIVYHLGDFWFGNAGSSNEAGKILGKLNGSKQLICGNHDGKIVKSLKGWSWVGDYKRVKIDKQAIVLFHYAIRSWHHMGKGSWHLYGHSHGELVRQGMSFDVGVDCNNYAPISFDEVCGQMVIFKMLKGLSERVCMTEQ